MVRVVDLDLTGAAREKTNAGNRGLSSAGAIEICLLRCIHQLILPYFSQFSASEPDDCVLASKYLQTGSGLTADGILRQHALNCELHSELRLLSHQGLVLNFLQTADPAGVMTIVLLGKLLTGQNRLVSVEMITKSPQ